MTSWKHLLNTKKLRKERDLLTNKVQKLRKKVRNKSKQKVQLLRRKIRELIKRMPRSSQQRRSKPLVERKRMTKMTRQILVKIRDKSRRLIQRFKC